MRRLPVLVGIVAVLSLAGTQSGTATVVHLPVTFWNNVATQAVTIGRAGPPGLLDLAIVHLAVHDAVQAIEGRYEPYLFEDASAAGSTQAAVAAAAYGVLAGIYPTQRPGPMGLDQIYADYVALHGLGVDPGLDVGADAAAVLLAEYRPLLPLAPYSGVNEIGEWRSTPPANLAMQFEFLAYTEPFTLLRPSQFRPEPPPPLTSGRYLRDYNEVKGKGAAVGSTRTITETDLAHFWSENFVAQWNRTLRTIADMAVPDTGDSARLFALANTAAADAAITSWESKIHFNFWRPITAIREGDNDGNNKTVGDPAWSSLVATPPYPDYTSGANNLTGAFTTILRLFFDTDEFGFSITSNAPLAVQKTRAYSRFSEVADEVVDARIFLGIHFRFADDAARDQGSHVAHWVFQKFLKPTPGGK